MNFYLILAFSASVFIPGMIGLIRLPQMETRYYPFVCFIWAGCFNEGISIALAMNGKSNYINSNIYVLAASLLLTWFFERNGMFGKARTTYYSLLASLILVWLVEVFWLKHITEITSYFRIIFSFIITLLSIRMVNSILVSGTGEIKRNTIFLICMAFSFYFTYRVLVEAFWIYGLKSSMNFQLLILNVSVFVNLFTNLIYAIALLWIPEKKPSILPY